MSKSFTKQHTRLDHASSTCNTVVRDTAGRGRGLFATRDIKAGELVLCEKAFCVAFETDEKTNRSVVLNFNLDSISIGSHATLVVRLVQKMLYNPLQAASFLQLYDGGYTPKSGHVVDDITAVDA